MSWTSAVGVIIGGAFGKVISSMVNDILMPPIGKAMGNVNFTDLFVNLDKAKTLPGGGEITSLVKAKEAGVAVVAYGSFINTVIDFVIVAFCIFILIKAMNALKKPAPAPAPAAPTTKDCPHCLSAIPIKATRCAHCTSELK